MILILLSKIYLWHSKINRHIGNNFDVGINNKYIVIIVII